MLWVDMDMALILAHHVKLRKHLTNNNLIKQRGVLYLSSRNNRALQSNNENVNQLDKLYNDELICLSKRREPYLCDKLTFDLELQ